MGRPSSEQMQRINTVALALAAIALLCLAGITMHASRRTEALAFQVIDIPNSMLRDVPWDPPPTPDDWEYMGADRWQPCYGDCFAEFDGCQNDWGVNKWKGLQFRRCYIDYQKCRQGCFPSERDYCAGC